MTISDRLKELNITLPDAPSPVGAYVATKKIGNLLYVSGQLPISNDGKTLYFVAEMEGGFGGYDIYSCSYDRRKKSWGDPKNLGEKINTTGDEKFPYISKSGALFFSVFSLDEDFFDTDLASNFSR